MNSVNSQAEAVPPPECSHRPAQQRTCPFGETHVRRYTHWLWNHPFCVAM